MSNPYILSYPSSKLPMAGQDPFMGRALACCWEMVRLSEQSAVRDSYIELFIHIEIFHEQHSKSFHSTVFRQELFVNMTFFSCISANIHPFSFSHTENFFLVVSKKKEGEDE